MKKEWRILPESWICDILMILVDSLARKLFAFWEIIYLFQIIYFSSRFINIKEKQKFIAFVGISITASFINCTTKFERNSETSQYFVNPKSYIAYPTCSQAIAKYGSKIPSNFCSYVLQSNIEFCNNGFFALFNDK